MTCTITDLRLNLQTAEFKLHLSENSTSVDAKRFRDIVMWKIPTWSIHCVTIEYNTSQCVNEILTQRLMLVPIQSEDIQEKDVFELTCVADAPTLITTERLCSQKQQIQPVYSDMIICNLQKGEMIKLRAELEQGTGEENAKWSPVPNMTFKKESDNVYDVHLETSGMISPKRVVDLAIQIYNRI